MGCLLETNIERVSDVCLEGTPNGGIIKLNFFAETDL